LPTADQGVLALGVTFPPDELPLETRVYAATEDGGWTWLGVRPLPGAPDAVGALLFAPPIRDGGALATWPTGAYRIQALLGPRVHTMEVHLPDRFEVVPSPPPETRPSAASPFAPVFQLDETDRAFVVEDGVARPLIGTPSSDPLDLARAWLDAETTADGAVLDQVPSIHAPRAAGLGVMLPVGARAHSGTITGLAPTTGDLGSRRALGVRFWDAGRSPYVIFRAPRGSTWPAGLYRMDVQWTDDDGSHRAAYHVELRPGPEASVPSALSAARVLAAAAGVDGVVAYAPGTRRPRPSDCGGSPGREPPTALGVTFDPHRSPDDIGVEMRLDGGRRQEQPVLKARDVVPGLTLLVPPTGSGFTPGVYALTLATGTTLEVRLACAAATPPG
jgi:hypothetical protein